MLQTVTAIRFEKPVSSGKTRPGVFACALEDATEVELVVKFAGGCDMKGRALATEAIAGMMAADLDLPVPEPFVVVLEPGFADMIPDPAVRERARRLPIPAFGSRKLPPGYSTILADRQIPSALQQTAAEILAFDTFIVNPDRSVANPNCLSNGRKFAIYDHELAFFTEGLIGWQPPWEPGGVVFPKGLSANRRHVFLEQLRGQELSFKRLAGAFDLLTNGRLTEYRTALPPEWIGDGQAVDGILDYIAELKRNVDAAIQQLNTALR
ncbi:MAG: hypothetical protein JNK85_29500 [Verrucomicrobiales bacterium]|nr:hypothetical protein [Verrucomicrobiales bacterium]